MPTVPNPLRADDCPLLKKFPARLGPVLEEFNRAVEVLRTLASKYPASLELADVEEAADRLTATRAALTTPRFKVGFLGPFQCGKSTTLNNVLGQEVSGVGVGKACTSVVTRLVANAGGAAPALSLRYFTVDEYQARRNTLCEWVRLKNPAGRSEPQLLEMLRTHNPDTGGHSSLRPVRPKDVPYLQAFLKSYESDLARGGKKLVRSEPHHESVAYASRDKLLTHLSRDDEHHVEPSQYLLVAESSITFSTDRVDPELELVDCPGLGSGRSVDDLLTREYIRQLDGALVFLRADSIDSAEAGEILSELHSRFSRDLKSRVWVIVNKMDVPERHAKLGTGSHKQSTFDVILELVRKNRIPLSQVCLACNGIFELATHSTSGAADRKLALNTLKLTAPGDEDAVLARLAEMDRDGSLKKAFEEMLKDGSVSLLRSLIRDTIGPSVANEILSRAGDDARRAAADLRYALEQAEKPANEQERKDAQAWADALYLIWSELSGGRPDGRRELFGKLEGLGRTAREQLEKQFADRTSDEVLGVMPSSALLERFGTDADEMQAEVGKQFERLVQAAYSEVTERIKARNLSPVTLQSGKEPLGLWGEFGEQDRRGGDWWDRLRPRLHDRGLLDRLSETGLHQTFDGSKYKELFGEKLRTAAHQITLAVRSRLRSRLETVRREVNRKLGTAAKATAE